MQGEQIEDVNIAWDLAHEEAPRRDNYIRDIDRAWNQARIEEASRNSGIPADKIASLFGTIEFGDAIRNPAPRFRAMTNSDRLGDFPYPGIYAAGTSDERLTYTLADYSHLDNLPVQLEVAPGLELYIDAQMTLNNIEARKTANEQMETQLRKLESDIQALRTTALLSEAGVDAKTEVLRSLTENRDTTMKSMTARIQLEHADHMRIIYNAAQYELIDIKEHIVAQLAWHQARVDAAIEVGVTLDPGRSYVIEETDAERPLSIRLSGDVNAYLDLMLRMPDLDVPDDLREQITTRTMQENHQDRLNCLDLWKGKYEAFIGERVVSDALALIIIGEHEAAAWMIQETENAIDGDSEIRKILSQMQGNLATDYNAITAKLYGTEARLAALAEPLQFPDE